MIDCTFCHQVESEDPFDFAQTRTETLIMKNPDDLKKFEEDPSFKMREIKKVITLACCKKCFEEGKSVNV